MLLLLLFLKQSGNITKSNNNNNNIYEVIKALSLLLISFLIIFADGIIMQTEISDSWQINYFHENKNKKKIFSKAFLRNHVAIL